jgi:hypothetical protein
MQDSRVDPMVGSMSPALGWNKRRSNGDRTQVQ